MCFLYYAKIYAKYAHEFYTAICVRIKNCREFCQSITQKNVYEQNDAQNTCFYCELGKYRYLKSGLYTRQGFKCQYRLNGQDGL